jgi:formylglycine-generating enzyme required for sulfatase activity
VILLWLSLLACNDPTTEAEAPLQPQRPLPQQPGVTWTEALSAEVELIPAEGACPDEDGDGSFHALDCPGASPTRLDCDDTDPSVTPETERWVRPGPFLMGSDLTEAGDDEAPVHVVQMSGYCLDRDEVTAQAFSAWLKKKRRRPQGADLRNITASGDVVPGRELHPVEGVTWSEASAFCRTQGKELPTEAQWEKAARGGCELGSSRTRCDRDDLRLYPWGNSPPSCEHANHQRSDGGPPTPCQGDTMPIGSLPAGTGPYGHRDLAGNVWEYVRDSYHPSVYSANRTRIDPAGPRGGAFHVLRGGGWSTFSTNMRAANRFHDLVMGSATGFRCARPDADSTYDPIDPLALVTLSGTLSMAPTAPGAEAPPLVGRAMYVTAFSKSDLDAGGAPILGRSPSAEVRLTPGGEQRARFKLQVPQGRVYVLQASLDDGTGDPMPASGSGGVGRLDEPVTADGDRSGLDIVLGPIPSHPPPHRPPSQQQQQQQQQQQPRNPR